MKLLTGLIGAVVLLVVMAVGFPILWPIASNTTAIDAMTGTDAGTTTFQALWPIILLLVGLGVAVGIIIYALKKFGLMGNDDGVGAFIPLLPFGVPTITLGQLPLFVAVITLVLIVAIAWRGRTRKFAVFRS